MATLRPPPYLALNTGGEPAGVAHSTGYLSEENGCIVFRPAESARVMTPVFPAGATALATDGSEWLGLYIKDDPVALGKVYRLVGDDASNGGTVTLASPTPVNCPHSYFVVRALATAVADGNVYRHCAGVIICRSFGMNYHSFCCAPPLRRLSIRHCFERRRS
jgi:hypothetical protein